MTSVDAAPGTEGREAPVRRTSADERVLTAGEALVGLAILVLGLGSWASLVLAHLGRHSAPAVLGVTVVVIGAAGVLVWRRHPVSVQLDGPGLLAAALVAAVAALFAFPGFPYGLADKDPGVYVAHAQGIDRTGSFDFDDPVLSPGFPDPFFAPGARFPGIWVDSIEDQRIVPQFYHLYPSALATAHEVGGRFGLVNFTPALAVLAAAGLALAARRAFGVVVGGLAGLLLATNMMQVWSAKNPQTEVMTQMFFVGAILGVVVALRTRWRPAAGAAGVLTGLAFLARPDGILLVMFAVLVGACVLAFRRWDGRATWFAVGLGVTLPHAWYQAYGVQRNYTVGNGVPAAWELIAIAGALVAGALVYRRRPHDRVKAVARRLDADRARVVAGVAIVGLAGVLMLLGFLRPTLFGEDLFDYNGRLIRSYDEDNLRRLAWFFTVPGVLAVWAGLAVVTFRRWRAAAWAVLLPAVLVIPVYVYEARISPRLMWWTRRFIPIAIVAAVVLIAVAVAWGLRRRGRFSLLIRAGALGVAGFVLASQAAMSWPLRSHHEFRGSFEAVEELDQVAAGEPSVFLWVRGEGLLHPARVLGGPLWLAKGHTSALLPVEPLADHVEVYRSRFADDPLYVVTREEQLPVALDGLPFDRVHRFGRTLPFWEETHEERPDEPQQSPVLAFTVWRLRG